MRILEQAGDLKGKKVFLRADLDVPVGSDGVIQGAEEFRIVRQRENLAFLLGHGARVIMGAHISAIPSFAQLVPQLQRILGSQINFCRDFDDAQNFLAGPGSLALLENLRTNPGEVDNSDAFAGQLVAGCDLYVNNAFAVCHREHASVATAPLIVPSYAGSLMVEETTRLRAVTAAPAAGKIVYIGGAKASVKAPVIRHLIDKAERIVVGGVVANDILKERGVDIGSSRVDEDAHELLAGIDVNDPRLMVPTDHVMENGQILDMGPQSAAACAQLAATARLIIWNGPMGKFEDERCMAGTRVIAQAIADSAAEKVIGGGDTVAAVEKLGLLAKMGFISTGGGAMLEFLAGNLLPGLKALGYYDDKT